MNNTVSLIGLHMGCFTLHNVEGMRVERSWALAKFIVASFSWPQTHFSYLCAFETSSLKITTKKLQPSPSLYFKKTKKSRWARERSCLSKQSWQVFTEEIIEFSSIPGRHPCQESQLLSVLSWTALRHSVNQWETKHLLLSTLFLHSSRFFFVILSVLYLWTLNTWHGIYKIQTFVKLVYRMQCLLV